MNNSETNINNFLDFLKQFEGDKDEHQFTIRAKAVRNAAGWTILHAVASYQSTSAGGNQQQKSYGAAWTTAEDNQTPQKVGELSIQLEIAGEKSPPEPFSQTDVSSIGTATRGVYDSVPQKVTAYAKSHNPDIELTVTSDD